MKRMQMIDLSRWNTYANGTDVDWELVRSDGIEAALIRVGDGSYKDPAYKTLATGALEHHIFVFPYYYFRPNMGYTLQATNFVTWAREVAYDGTLQGDFETTGGLVPASTSLNFFHQFLLRVDGLIPTGALPAGIYTSVGFWQSVNGHNTSWALTEGRNLWLAQWPWDRLSTVKLVLEANRDKVVAGEINPSALAPWGEPDLWQVTSKMTIPGIPVENTDWDVSFEDSSQFLERFHLSPYTGPSRPSSFEELVDRFMALENWAIQQGYIPKE